MARAEGSEFTLLDRKVFNVLLAMAYKHLAGATIHRIALSDLTSLFFEHGRSNAIKETLERLWSQKIAIDYIGEDGAPHSMRCHYLSFDMCQIENGYLDYAFDPILMRFIHNPKVYSFIQLNTVRRFKTAAGLKLYEQMIAYYGRHHPVWNCALPEAHVFFEAKGVYKDRFDRFRERVIEPAVNEVNALAEFDVTVEYQFSGRGNKVVGLRFTAHPKPAERIASSTEAPTGRPRRRDRDTVDMFQGLSDNEHFAVPVLRVDTLAEARRIVGSDGNVNDLVENWNQEFGRKGFGQNPDETFLAWVRMQLAKVRDPEVADLDIDAIFLSMIGDK